MIRRDFIKMGSISPFVLQAGLNSQPISATPSFRHSICRWCYNSFSLEELSDRAKELNIESIELLDVSEWDTVLDRGLRCAVSNGSKLGITKGFNAIKYHAQLLEEFRTIIPLAAEKGIPNVISFSGNRNGISDEQGLENAAIGLEPIVKLAEKYDVTIVMELLNSKVDHHDYQCDHTAWGVQLVDKIGSDHFKLLYDIYHMQIMEGNIIDTIEKYSEYIAHFHTGGVPGRNEIDETQELNYAAICRAIEKTGFKAYVAQEFIPTWDNPFEALAKAIKICEQ